MLIALFVSLTVAVPARAGQPTREVTGSLETQDGVRVLRVWGRPFDCGYAHGYLLGDTIIRLFEDVIFDPRVMPDTRIYEAIIRRGLLPRMLMTTDERDELEGMMAGIADRVGSNGLLLERVGRKLDVDDLKAVNTLADWNPSACSSFAAWGPGTADGHTIVARNLDYFDLPHLNEEHLVFARAGDGAGVHGYVAIGWPSLIGVFTGMNDEGVFVAMHDAPGGRAIDAPELAPRSLVLRRILRSAGAAHAVEDAAGILEKCRSLRGNNFLVAAPFTGQKVPAAVFEYDGRTDQNGGVTIRPPGAALNDTPDWTVACTNHYRLRAAPPTCNRYQTMVDGLGAIDTTKHKLDAASAFDIIRQAAVTGTIHTVIALPNEKEMQVRFASPGHAAPQNPPHGVNVSELLHK